MQMLCIYGGILPFASVLLVYRYHELCSVHVQVYVQVHVQVHVHVVYRYSAGAGACAVRV